MSERLGRVLGHPLRRRLLFEYAARTSGPAALARLLDAPLNVVAYHTGVLVREGLIELVRTERRRGAVTRLYRATVTPAIDGTAWEDLPVALRRALTLGTLEQALAEARDAALGSGFEGPDVQLSRSPLLLDEPGVDAVADLLRRAFAELEAIVSRPAAGHGAPYEVVMLAYEAPG